MTPSTPLRVLVAGLAGSTQWGPVWRSSPGFTTGQFYGCANLLASWAGKDTVCAVGFGSKATATSCGIRNLCVWQKESGSERPDRFDGAIQILSEHLPIQEQQIVERLILSGWRLSWKRMKRLIQPT